MEGGANRTLFSCGVADALLENGILPDVFVGVSAGIAFGVSYLSQQKGRNLALAQRFVPDARYMGARHLLNPKNRCYYNLKYSFTTIPNTLLPFDYAAYAAYLDAGREAYAVVTNVNTGLPEYLPVPKGAAMTPLLTASCALPLIFPTVRVNGTPYLDGGLADSIPYKKAIERGCDKNIVLLTRPRGYTKKQESSAELIKLAYGRHPAVTAAMKARPARYNAAIAALHAAEARGELLSLAPEDPCGVSRLERDPQKLTALYRHGYELALREMPRIKAYLGVG